MTEAHSPGSRKRRTRRIYFCGVTLAALLFAIHTWVLFEMSVLLVRLAPPAIEAHGPHLAGPLLILSTFLILFTTHMGEAAIWALFFWKMREFSTFGESMYFAGTSLTALGYGDVLLRSPWRGLGPVMATNGILLFGCSTAFLFLIIQKIWVIMEHAL